MDMKRLQPAIFNGHGKYLIAVAAALASIPVLILAGHGVSRPESTHSLCPALRYQDRQPLVSVSDDGTVSTASAALRSQYAKTTYQIAEEAASRGAYLIIKRFAATIGDIETICETSTRVTGTAPLFVLSQSTHLRQSLGSLADRANPDRAESGSSIYGALVDAIQDVQALRVGNRAPAKVVLITDGDEVADGVHLRRLLSSYSNREIARRIVGGLPPPNARGLDIEILGIGRIAHGEPLSTVSVRRMLDVWRRICVLARARSCMTSSNLN